MPAVPGLRSPYATVGRLVYFGRMVDKLRLLAAGALPPDYVANVGDVGAPNVFDARCCRFLGVRHADLADRIRSVTTSANAVGTVADLGLLRWAEQAGGFARTDEECEIWNTFMMKRGWRDAVSPLIAQRVREWGADPVFDAEGHTMFDVLDLDEGRDPRRERLVHGHAPAVVVVMGVLGSGKTTLGRALAADLRWDFVDADDFHPPANRAKLAAGHPLNDDDRAPWLAALRTELARRHATCVLGHAAPAPCVLACSALRAAYRETLRVAPARQRFAYLKISPELAAERSARRGGHYAAPALLASQFATLEEPNDAEALRLNAATEPAAQVAMCRRRLGL
jgi:carbohydrate kinase (thermoresistant glucokinase family)